MRLITRVYSPEEAEMIAEVLRNNSITPLVQGENFAALYRNPIGAKVSEIRIFVEEDQFDVATDLICAFFGKCPQEFSDEEDEPS